MPRLPTLTIIKQNLWVASRYQDITKLPCDLYTLPGLRTPGLTEERNDHDNDVLAGLESEIRQHFNFQN